MVPTTIHRPNPMENVLRGSIDHTETLWTLNITLILLVSSGDLISTSKNRCITVLDVFVSESQVHCSALRIRNHRIEVYMCVLCMYNF